MRQVLLFPLILLCVNAFSSYQKFYSQIGSYECPPFTAYDSEDNLELDGNEPAAHNLEMPDQRTNVHEKKDALIPRSVTALFWFRRQLFKQLQGLLDRGLPNTSPHRRMKRYNPVFSPRWEEDDGNGK